MDAGRTTLVYLDENGARQVVSSGGQILIENGGKITIGGVDITASTLTGNLAGLTSTATELNQLHGSGVTEADLAKLHAATGAAIASGTEAALIATITNTATGTEIATAVNAIIAALEAFGIAASS